MATLLSSNVLPSTSRPIPRRARGRRSMREYFCGLDVAVAETAVCVIDDKGQAEKGDTHSFASSLREAAGAKTSSCWISAARIAAFNHAKSVSHSFLASAAQVGRAQPFVALLEARSRKAW